MGDPKLEFQCGSKRYCKCKNTEKHIQLYAHFIEQIKVKIYVLLQAIVSLQFVTSWNKIILFKWLLSTVAFNKNEKFNIKIQHYSSFTRRKKSNRKQYRKLFQKLYYVLLEHCPFSVLLKISKTLKWNQWKISQLQNFSSWCADRKPLSF